MEIDCLNKSIGLLMEAVSLRATEKRKTVYHHYAWRICEICSKEYYVGIENFCGVCKRGMLNKKYYRERLKKQGRNYDNDKC